MTIAVGEIIFGPTFGLRTAGPEPDKKRVLALATSSRHPGVAAAIAYANFQTRS
jgi:hypothetical protein